MTQILLLSDDSLRATTSAQYFGASAPAIQSTIAGSWPDAERKLAEAAYDALVVDEPPAGHDLRRSLLAIREAWPRLVVVVTEHHSVSDVELRTLCGVDEVIPRFDDVALAVPVILTALERPSRGHVSLDVCIGRSRQQMTMEDVLANTRKGQGAVVVCSGEAGMGKTRGIRWLAQRVVHYGGLVLQTTGRDGTPDAYASLADIIDQLIDADHAVRDYAVQIVKRRPEVTVVARRLRDVAPSSNGGGRPPDPAVILRALDTLLRHATRRHLILLVVDDAHLADRQSMETLERLAPAICQLGMVAFVAYRDEDLLGGPVAQAIHTLERQSATIGLRLEPLADDAIAEFFRRHWGRPPSRDETDLARAMTGGNPGSLGTLLAHEHGRTLDARGSLERWLVERIDRLPELDRETLEIAAVIGLEFDATLLVEIWNAERRKHEAQALDGVLRDLCERRLVRPIRDSPRYVFVHPTLRDAVYARCSDAARLHARIALALAGRHAGAPNGRAAIVADHFLRADEPRHVRKALEWIDAAVAASCRQHAHDEAIKLLQRLLDGRLLARPDEHRCERLCLLSKLLWRRGRAADAEARALEALDIARRLRDPRFVATAVLAWAARGRGFGTAAPNSELVAAMDSALAGLGSGDAALEARLAATLADELRFTARDRAAELAERARRAAKRSGDRSAQAEVASLVQWTRWRTTDLPDRSLLIDELELDGNDPCRRFDIALARVWIANERGDKNVELLTDKCARIAADLDDRYRTWLAEHTALCLDVGRANVPLDDHRLLERMEHVRTLGIEAGSPFMAGLYFTTHLAIGWFWKGLLADHARHLRGLRTPFPDLGPAVHGMLAMTYAYAGRIADARHELAAVTLDSLPQDETWLLNACVLAEAYAEVGDHTAATRLYDALLPFAGRTVVVPPVAVLLPVDYHLGRLACATRQPQLAQRHLEMALELEASRSRPVALACIQLATAEALRAHGAVADQARADVLVADVLAACDRLQLHALRCRASAAVGPKPLARVQPRSGSLVQDGDLWWFQLEPGPLFALDDCVGIRCLAAILESREGVRAADLAAMLDNRGPQPMAHEALDEPDEDDEHTPRRTHRDNPFLREQINEVKRRLAIAEATGSPDEAGLRKLLREMECQPRMAQRSPSKRADNRILNALKRVFDKIADSDPAAAQHLRMHVRTGGICIYVPDLRHPVTWIVKRRK